MREHADRSAKWGRMTRRVRIIVKIDGCPTKGIADLTLDRDLGDDVRDLGAQAIADALADTAHESLGAACMGVPLPKE